MCHVRKLMHHLCRNNFEKYKVLFNRTNVYYASELCANSDIAYSNKLNHLELD
jgi:hypothetical protein